MTVSVLEGDCLDVLRALPDARFQTCVTSPPYFGLRDYGVAGQIGLEDTPDAFVDRLVEVFREVRRVLRDDGTLWLNLGDSYASSPPGNKTGASMKSGLNGAQSSMKYRQTLDAGRGTHAGTLERAKRIGLKQKDRLMIPARVALALQADGWWLRDEIVWHKPRTTPFPANDRTVSAHEMVYLLAKRERYFFDWAAIEEPAVTAGVTVRYSDKAKNVGMSDVDSIGGAKRPARDITVRDTRRSRSVWSINPQPYRGAHFATMPPRLVERCIKAGTSEAGACPHCGAPWERERERLSVEASGAAIGGDPARQDAGMRQRDPSGRGGNVLAGRWASTGSFAPICDCPAPKPIPCAVLDPFGGAGTTGLVANRLGRAATLIELNPAYAALARQRIHGEAPLFAGAAE